MSDATILKYLQLPFLFDAARLQADVRLLEHKAWQRHYQKLHYDGNWTALPLRAVGGRANNIIVSPTEGSVYEDTPFLSETPYLRDVLAQFKCPQRTVRLMKLAAGAVIKEHIDAELYFEKGEARIHIPVVTHADLEFCVEGERMRLEEGECWYINFNLPHSVRNRSQVDRIHLVVDVDVNDWLRELFASPSIIVRKEIPDPCAKFDRRTMAEMAQRFRLMNTPTGDHLADEYEARLAAPW